MADQSSGSSAIVIALPQHVEAMKLLAMFPSGGNAGAETLAEALECSS